MNSQPDRDAVNRVGSNSLADPLVSVVVPARNEDRFLRQCLRSIREQWYQSWECVVVDDGSTDDTGAIAQEFVHRDSRFQVVTHAEGRGLASARNTGIARTRAPYVTFLDADDFLYQDSLKARVESLAAPRPGNLAGTYCDWQPTRERQGRTPPDRMPADKPDIVGFIGGPECPFIATAPVIRRDVLEALGGFDEDLATAEDFDLWIRVMRAGYTFKYVPMIGVAYRQKASGMIFTGTALHAKVSNEIIMAQYDDLSDCEVPPVFARPLPYYTRDAVIARRLLRSYAICEAFGEDEGLQQIAAMFPDTLPLLSRTGLDVSAELKAGLARASRALKPLNDPEVRQAMVESLVLRLGLSSET